jgi:hypothetical protein
MMGSAMKLHTEALGMRCENPATFAFDLLTSNRLFDFLEMGKSVITYYDLHARKPFSFPPRHMDIVQIHDLLVQALMKERVECPLKHGRPFFCKNANEPEETLCRYVALTRTKEAVWQGECLADLFDSVLAVGSTTATAHK